MKRLVTSFVIVLIFITGAYATGGGGSVHPQSPAGTVLTVDNTVDASQSQNVSVVGGGDADATSTSISEGGDASADSKSSSNASISTRSSSNYETRTPPLSVFPPYLPYWTHGGWGTVKGYFPNGPNNDDAVYERVFDPSDSRDMKELRGVIESLSYDGPLDVLGGILNGVGVILCGGPDNYHRGRGFQIANSLTRKRRPDKKPLLVFIDSNVDRELLKRAGYAYVGQVGIEGKMERSWDHVYDAAVAETLPWDVDILLVSGGMKGVTVGSNISFPGAAGAYSQANYSLSLVGSVSTGITEGKGKAILSAEAYRFWPEASYRRNIPQSIYNSICYQSESVSQAIPRPTIQPGRQPRLQQNSQPASRSSQPPEEMAQSKETVVSKGSFVGVQVSPELMNMAGF
jgi:hypothetical protein